MTSVEGYDAAMERALKYLGPRARSRGEVAEHLHKSGHDRESIEMALGRLEELSILDDARYALEAANQGRAMGKGADAIRRALPSKGISEAVIEAAVSGVFGADDAQELALQEASRRVLKLKGLPLVTQHRRLADYLVRRGHDPETAHSVCRQVLEDSRGVIDHLGVRD